MFWLLLVGWCICGAIAYGLALANLSAVASRPSVMDTHRRVASFQAGMGPIGLAVVCLVHLMDGDNPFRYGLKWK